MQNTDVQTRREFCVNACQAASLLAFGGALSAFTFAPATVRNSTQTARLKKAQPTARCENIKRSLPTIS